MTVKELIEKLGMMPATADVVHLWDGEPRTSIELVWLSRNGQVVTSDYGMVCYSEGSLPVDAPTKAEDKYWSTPRDPREDA